MSTSNNQVNHLTESTDNNIALPTNEQPGQSRPENRQEHRPEHPIGIPFDPNQYDECDFGATPRNERTIPYAFDDLEFTFEKKSGCCTKQNRKVIITTDIMKGREIRIYSKNGTDILEKNHIPFTYSNPIVTQSSHTMDIRRSDNSIVTLHTTNPTLITVFTNEINSHREKIIKFHNILWKWTHCFQSSVIRMVQNIKNTKQQTTETRTRTLRYERHIKNMSKHFITTALRYLTNHLQHGTNGYTSLLKYFFNKWYKEYNRNCIKESIKKNHEAVQRITNLFNTQVHTSRTTSSNPYNITPKIHQTVKIANHVNSVNTELSQIVSNLQNITYCTNENASNDYSETDRINVVKNLQQLADLRHHLQTMNNEEEEFILVGDQSSGKSSLLCMLLGVNIGYTSEHFATRCPVRYQLEPCAPSHGWHYQFENPQTKEFEVVTQEELQKKLTVHFEKVIGRQIVYNPITIKIHSPVCTSSMTLVDLPGLVGKGSDKIKQQQHSKSYHIVQEYLKKQNNIVLFVQRVDLDVGSLNTMILDEVQKRTPDKVVYCLTHFDRICSDKDVRLEEIMRIIESAQKEIACNKDMFLLSLSKKVEDLSEKEHATTEIINRLTAEFPNDLDEIQYILISVL